jgi:hypothetical protein
LKAEELPSTEIAVATLYASEIERSIIELLARATNEDSDGPSARLLFRGVHILGGRCLTTDIGR